MCPSKPLTPPPATSSKEQRPKSSNEQWSESMPITNPLQQERLLKSLMSGYEPTDLAAYRKALEESLTEEQRQALELGSWDHPAHNPLDDLKRLYQHPIVTEPPFKLLVRHDASPQILHPEDLQIIKGNFENKGSFPPETFDDHPDPTPEQKTEQNWHVDPPSNS